MSALLFARIGYLDNACEPYLGATAINFGSVSKVGPSNPGRIEDPARRSNRLRLTHEIEQADRFRRREESHDHRAEGPDPIRIRVIMEPTSVDKVAAGGMEGMGAQQRIPDIASPPDL